MRALLFGLAAALIAGPALATGETDVVNFVKAYDAAINRGDMKSAAAMCAADATIIDEFPPHFWQAPGACDKWGAAADANDKASGTSDGIVVLGAPLHVTLSGTRAYAVFAAQYNYKSHGKPMSEDGVWTLVLKKSTEGWRIKAWAWAQH